MNALNVSAQLDNLAQI